MDNKKIFSIVLIVFVAILVSGAIIFRPESLFRSQPEQVVQDFYTWYLDYIGDPASGNFQNPLVDKAYHNSDYLTASFAQHIDDVLAGFEGQSGYDPFLCAQAIPTVINTDGVFQHGELASVIVRTNFIHHYMTVDLIKNGNKWNIMNITCGFSPEGTAQAFYTWYLAYIGDRTSGEMHNPLVDGAYRESGFLSDAYILELDSLTAGGIPADPILMAQDIPHDFSVDPGVDENTAIVHLQFGSETVRHLKVSMVSELGAWKINSISLIE